MGLSWRVSQPSIHLDLGGLLAPTVPATLCFCLGLSDTSGHLACPPRPQQEVMKSPRDMYPQVGIWDGGSFSAMRMSQLPCQRVFLNLDVPGYCSSRHSSPSHCAHICFIVGSLMVSCDFLRVTDSTIGAPAGKEELCHEGKHCHNMTKQVTSIALETSLLY